jgi:hypothetical protein
VTIDLLGPVTPMTTPRTLGILVTLLLPIAAGAAEARGQMFITNGAGTLRGLPGVEVVIDALQPELTDGGLTSGLIKSDIENRLQKAGITIFQSQAANPSAAKPYLHLAVNAVALPSGTDYVLGVQLQLRQMLRSPVTDSQIVNATTWDLQNVYVVSTAELPAMRAEIVTFVEEFVEDWTSVH